MSKPLKKFWYGIFLSPFARLAAGGSPSTWSTKISPWQEETHEQVQGLAGHSEHQQEKTPCGSHGPTKVIALRRTWLNPGRCACKPKAPKGVLQCTN